MAVGGGPLRPSVTYKLALAGDKGAIVRVEKWARGRATAAHAGAHTCRTGAHFSSFLPRGDGGCSMDAMDRIQLASIRKQLLKQGRALLRSGGTGGTSLAGLSGEQCAVLGRIHAALDRIERGCFGRCAVCSGAIGSDWLEATPWAERCAACLLQVAQPSL